MKQITILYIIIGVSIAGCSSSQEEEGTALQDGTSETGVYEHDPVEMQRRTQGIAAELAYYLERHNVLDEGYDMVAHYADEGDSTLVTYLPTAPLHLFNIGRWRNHQRKGTGVTKDATGRPIIALFENDTLVSGIRLDTLGVYAGRLTRNGEAQGHGAYRSTDGSFYEGEWLMDMRQGFGFCVSPTYLHVGHWRKDRFIGERMSHTPERIYGIDVARYQHELGHRRYGINWKQVRITGLGHRISEQQVNGNVNYPVSFVYIKSTQGTAIRNSYYAADYLQARRQGIAVGAYHFFSPKLGAREQASNFLNNTIFKKGDLPPVLDVEPTNAQVEAMGGAEKMFSEIRIWLQLVEKWTGVRPIIYVNQNFVKKYLDLAPDIKHDYHVWIARYGEYKPDVHLTFWQLSSDGYVRGIRNRVDINVFNGFQSQWEDFLRKETIR